MVFVLRSKFNDGTARDLRLLSGGVMRAARAGSHHCARGPGVADSDGTPTAVHSAARAGSAKPPRTPMLLLSQHYHEATGVRACVCVRARVWAGPRSN